MNDYLETLLSSIIFRHQSQNYFSVLEPITYNKISKQRKNKEYIEDRIKDEKQYHNLLKDSNLNCSFLYSTILGFHKMESPISYPGYTYYFHLTLKQIE